MDYIHFLCRYYTYRWKICFVEVRVMVFNATFNNISVISWRSVLLMGETKLFYMKYIGKYMSAERLDTWMYSKYQRGMNYGQLISECLLFNAKRTFLFSYIMARTSYIRWDENDEVRFAQDQHSSLDFCSASSLNQHPLVDVSWYITMIPNQPVFVLSP